MLPPMPNERAVRIMFWIAGNIEAKVLIAPSPEGLLLGAHTAIIAAALPKLRARYTELFESGSFISLGRFSKKASL